MSVERSAAIAGNPGKYISMEKGPMADKEPRIHIIVLYCFRPIAGFDSGKTMEEITGSPLFWSFSLGKTRMFPLTRRATLNTLFLLIVGAVNTDADKSKAQEKPYCQLLFQEKDTEEDPKNGCEEGKNA